MVGISKLYCGVVEPSDVLRYQRKSGKLPSNLLQFSIDKKPVVVWNVGRRCNLHCVHCYSHSHDKNYGGELTTDQAKKMIKSLGDYGCPVLLLSGGEPLMRPDLFDLAHYAKECGLRVVVSTNGTLITKQTAQRLKEVGLSYVGVSLDGLEGTNDSFRGVKGAYQRALEGIRHCKDAGVKVGLRFTISKKNVQDVPGIFDLLVAEDIPRVCFYHLVYAGRGAKISSDDLGHDESRKIVDCIIDKTKELFDAGHQKEILTVDNHADGVYLYLRMVREKDPRARDVLTLLKMNGGNSTGVGIGCISWDGEVHADQFWRHYSFGNVKERPFSEIWQDINDPVMKGLKDRRSLLKGKCGRCVWQDICNGNFRVRAEAMYDDMWAEDPACYLTDEEIITRVEV